MKTSLLVANDSRDETRDSDSWGTNVLLDAEVPAAAVKRPGLTLTYDGTSPGQGVFIWPEYGTEYGIPTVVSVEDDELTFPIIIKIGDLVDDWYAMVDNPSTPPAAGDPYWSSTPPDSRRYQAWTEQEILIASLYDAGAPSDPASTNWAGSTNCYATTKLAASPAAAVKQALRYLPRSCPGRSTSTIHTQEFLGPVFDTIAYAEVVYYPYNYVFTSPRVRVYDVEVVILNDTICTDVIHTYGSTVICAVANMYVRNKAVSGPAPIVSPSCSLAADYDTTAFSIVRRV